LTPGATDAILGFLCPDRHRLSKFDRRTFLSRLAIAGASPTVLTACLGDDTTPITTSYTTAVQRVLAEFHIPGALVSVRHPGDSEWKQAFGYADVASRTPIDPDSYFPIRSITKSFTVTLQLKLAADRLDSPIAPFFPTIPNAGIITFADLAGMQSGIADYSGTPEFLKDFGANLARSFTEQQLVDYAIPYSPTFSPRAQYDYSNTNTVLLGMFVRLRTSEPIAATMQRLIFGPLGLTHTAYPDAIDLPLPHPTPYAVDATTGELEPLPLISPTALAGAGAMTSTLDDLQIWGAALGDGRLIGADLQLARIQRSRVVTSGPEYDRYGLGIGILKGWWGHTGTGFGWQVDTFYDPASHATIAVMVNATPTDTSRRDLNFAQEIFEAVADVVAQR
jgi:D-alanyl-D-alanine carboxypeptidase